MARSPRLGLVKEHGSKRRPVIARISFYRAVHGAAPPPIGEPRSTRFKAKRARSQKERPHAVKRRAESEKERAQGGPGYRRGLYRHSLV